MSKNSLKVELEAAGYTLALAVGGTLIYAGTAVWLGASKLFGRPAPTVDFTMKADEPVGYVFIIPKDEHPVVNGVVMDGKFDDVMLDESFRGL